jgi:hypothetical protein
LVWTTPASAHKTSSLLPKGIFRARVVNVFGQPVVNKYDQNGDRKELLAPLERTVGASSLADANADLKALYDTLNTFEPELGDQLYSADLLADAKINFRQTTAALEYGLTPSVSIGVIVPFTQVMGSSSFGARVTSNAAAIREKVKGTLLEDGVAQFESQMPTRDVLADTIFTSNGYQVPGEFSYAGLGDIEVGALVQTTKAPRFLSAIQAGFRLPTATHKRDYTNLLDQGTGDEQLDFAVEAGFDANLTSNLMTGFHTRYTWQIGRQAEIPVLKSGQSGLPNLRDPSTFVVVDRDLGDYLENEVYLDYTINKAWSPYIAYMHTLRGSDRYKGPAGYNYTALAADTSGQAHTLMVGFTVSTLNSYLAKQIPVPLKFDFSFNKILGGTNKTNSAFGRLDLIVFF